MAEQCFDKIPVIYIVIVLYVDPINRQTFEYANQKQCENNPRKVTAVDTDTDQYYALTRHPNKLDPASLFGIVFSSPNVLTKHYNFLANLSLMNL